MILLFLNHGSTLCVNILCKYRQPSLQYTICLYQGIWSKNIVIFVILRRFFKNTEKNIVQDSKFRGRFDQQHL